MKPEGTAPSLLGGCVASLMEDSFGTGEVAIALFFVQIFLKLKQRGKVTRHKSVGHLVAVAVSETRIRVSRLSRK